MQILGILKLPCAAVSMFLPIPSANQILFSTIYISPPNQEPQEYCQHLGLRSRSIAHPHLPRNSSVALNFSPYSKEGTKSDTKIKQATTQLHSGLGLGPLMHLCKPLKHHILHQSFSACWAWHWCSSIWLSIIQLLLILFRKVALHHHCSSFARSVCQSKGLKSTVLLTFFYIIIIFDILYFENTEIELFQKRLCVFQACLTWLGLNLDEDNWT